MHATARGRHAAGMPPAARRGAARAARRPRREGLAAAPSRVWLFDLDNTLHNASASAFAEVNAGMTRYIVEHLGLAEGEADALRRDYWLRYGATLLGLVRHHAVHAPHFLHATHRLPQLEARVHGHRHDFAALARLPGRRVLLTNAPAAYTARVLGALGIAHWFDDVVTIEDMRMFGQWRPKPDRRMLRRLLARLRVPAARCVLVEDTLGHQKAARRLGIGTAWMQRWTRAAGWGVAAATRTRRRPAYVDRRLRRLAELLRAR
ncbi:MAG TPA: HAD-IA family hydrolase [Rubrivivax sp.]|nr:HAD-IA family hydrolase [Rubrivivax sp.]